jgi:hypothetical protein
MVIRADLLRLLYFLRRSETLHISQYSILLGQYLITLDYTGSFPGRCKIFVPSSKRPYRLWGPPRLLFDGYLCSFSGLKRLGSEVNHSPPRVEVTNGWSFSSTHAVCLHGVDRGSWAFFFGWTGCFMFRVIVVPDRGRCGRRVGIW